MVLDHANDAARTTHADPKALVRQAIHHLNAIHAAHLDALDRALLREAILLLWRVVEPANGGEAHARVW